ncbi:MAG TPA: NfeD family protein [Hyphomicrobiaceae bacterium]|jgi:membrane protein implicated in regulation of membrane protease activity
MSFYNFFAGLGPWNWFILAVILFALETVIPGVHFLWFGVAAVLIGLLALATDIAWQWQLIAFAIIAVATVFLVRRYARPDATLSDLPDLNVRGAQYIGRTVTVEEPIRSGRGKVRVGDTVWQAEGPDSAAGSRVRVTSVNGTVLVVEREGA